jgi:hypothetical protein
MHRPDTFGWINLTKLITQRRCAKAKSGNLQAGFAQRTINH